MKFLNTYYSRVSSSTNKDLFSNTRSHSFIVIINSLIKKEKWNTFNSDHETQNIKMFMIHPRDHPHRLPALSIIVLITAHLFDLLESIMSRTNGQ